MYAYRYVHLLQYNVHVYMYIFTVLSEDNEEANPPPAPNQHTPTLDVGALCIIRLHVRITLHATYPSLSMQPSLMNWARNGQPHSTR